jgi:hypothetical protein
MHNPITFSQESFVRGFNITIGTSYKLQDKVADMLQVEDLYMRDIQSDRDAELKC